MKESVGEVQCRYCDEGQLAEVRRNEKGKLYLFCRECGIHHLNSAKGQEWILENAKLYGADGKPAKAAQPPAPKPQPKAAPAAAAVADDDEDDGDEF